jgi:hypothetical protein
MSGQDDWDASELAFEPAGKKLDRAALEAKLTEAQKKFRNDRAAEMRRMLDENDSEYWVCIYFGTREQKETYLAAAHLIDLGDKYLDGEAVAERQGISLDPALRGRNIRHRLDRTWSDLV